MIILPEMKKIAGAMDKVRRLSVKLEKKTDIEGLVFNSATLISGCKEKNGCLYDSNGSLLGSDEGEYYCEQHQGYIEDCWYGYMGLKLLLQRKGG